MIELRNDEIASLILSGKVVKWFGKKTFFNERYKALWVAPCIEFTDGTTLAMCADDEPECILLEKDG